MAPAQAPDPSPNTPARGAAVYRLRGDAGELLYIGSAYDPEQRCRAHEAEPWWPQVAARDDEWHPTRGHAYHAEMVAIGTDGPEFNVMGTPAYREECSRRAHEDPAHRARIRAGSAAANGAPREIVQAILRGDLKSYGRRSGPVHFDSPQEREHFAMARRPARPESEGAVSERRG